MELRGYQPLIPDNAGKLSELPPLYGNRNLPVNTGVTLCRIKLPHGHGPKNQFPHLPNLFCSRLPTGLMPTQATAFRLALDWRRIAACQGQALNAL